ncbi:hypothetical protein Leryth_018762 [Lithospermum erythrorhizon]|nr:hypothetical protein Leryth_018762 [Lithospermum erythrorhizon]
MASSLQRQLQILLLLLILISFFISAASTTTSPPPSAIPQPPNHFLYASILSTLGFTELSSATFAANLTTTTPITIFAPSDSSLLTCPSCSLPLLLQEHSIPGLYPLHFLRNLAFGTKLETTAPNRCLTITTTTSTGAHDQKVFVNGVEITSPDLFNNGLVMVHGLQGFITHLSPISCNVERMTSLTFPPQTMTAAASFSIMRLMLKDVIVRLRNSGYSFVALALRLKSAELLELKSMTIFALDDASIFAGEGFAYLSHFRFHVVPNKRIAASELLSLPAATVLPTLETGQQLVVTTAGGGGTLAPININYVKVTTIDLLHNGRIAVHGVSAPFPHMHHSVDEEGGYGTIDEKTHCDPTWHNGGACHLVNNAEVPVAAQIGIAGDHEDHHGL